MRVQSLGWEDPPEKRMATHSSILAWEIPCTEEPGGLQYIGLQRLGTDLVTKQTALTWKNSSLYSWFQHFLSVSSLFPVLSLSSNVQLFTTPWTVACHASLSIGFFRQEYWSGFPFPSPGDLLTQGLNPYLLNALNASRFFTTSATWEAIYTLPCVYICQYI